MSISVVGKDSANNLTLIKNYSQLKTAIYPGSSSVLSAGQSVNFQIVVDQNKKLVLHHLYFRYKIKNNNATKDIYIPIYAIWSLLEYMKVFINGELVVDMNNRMGKFHFIRQLNDVNSVIQFLHDRTGTCGYIGYSALNATSPIQQTASSYFYRSNIDEIVPDLLTHRANSNFRQIDIQIQMISSASALLDSYYLGLEDNTINLGDVQLTNLSLHAEYTEYPNNSAFHKNEPVSILYPYLQRKQYPTTSQGIKTFSINLNTDFVPASSLNCVYWFITNSALGTITHLTNSVNMFCDCVTSLELTQDGVRILYLEDRQEILNQIHTQEKRRGLKRINTIPAGAGVSTYSMSARLDFNQDLHEVEAEKIHTLTNITNDGTQGIWMLNLTVDTSAFFAECDVLNIVLESNRIITLPACCSRKPPTVSR